MDTRSQLLLGIHAVVGVLFVGFAVLGLMAGAEPAAVGLRFLLGVLVVGLGVAVARI